MSRNNDEMALSPWQPLNGQRVRRISRRNAGAHDSREGGAVKVCTVNVGTLVVRSREVVEMLARRRVDICCIQEVRYRNQGSTTFGSNEQKYKFWYSGNKDGTNGVGILMKQELAEKVIEVERYSDRMMKVKMVIGRVVYEIFSVYAPQTGRPAQEKMEFWENLEDEVARVPESEGVIVGGI
jgi:exonuclease III